ncbi:hypothetical protein RJ640_027041 [Escallonia rubra]|uniref:Disease resistance protein RPM1-like n=1 Tax=Escallonia rubra TaxID=112253 RepID=A0AA88UQI2_9ASTE|nr:hypothetical protein RJ640_027041 [Escallonia rubra]
MERKSIPRLHLLFVDTRFKLCAVELAVSLHDEKSLLGGVREEAEYIRAKLEQMRAFLSVADAKEESDPRLEVLIKQVRDVAYDTEDILDEFILGLVNNHRDGFFGPLYRITWYVKKIKAHHQIASKIKMIRPRIDNIFQNYGGFDYASRSTIVNDAWQHDRRGDALFKDKWPMLEERVFLSEEKSLLGGFREEAEYIRAKLEQMRAFLRIADAKEESDPRLQVWIKQVRNVAYDTEDILDEFILHLANNHRDEFFGSLYRITWYVKKIKAHHQIATKIQRIRARIDNILQSYAGFDHGSSSTITNNAWLDRRGDALLIEEAELVGIERPKRQLISWLVNDDSGLKVVSVAGMGGSGKTTLVKKVYEDTEVKRYFQCPVWINIEELLKQVIHQLFHEVSQPVPQAVEIMDSHGMKEHIRNFLQHSRYVLVLDDVWSLDAWIAMEIALPDNSHGSRVLLTTRDLKIASTCCLNSSGKTYTMNALSPKESWTLFCKKVFQGNDCPQPLYPLSKCFLEKCEGLPLAIVAMGGFLATKDRRIEESDMIRRSLGDELDSNDQFGFMKRILFLSYFDLPSHLKKKRLIQLWIAEGFLQVREGKTLEEVAENYLNNLVNRSLVQVARTTLEGKLRTCRSREQSIGTIISGHNAKWRCLAIHNSVENIHQSESYSRLRSLLIFGVVDPLSKSSISMFLSSRLLKVLDLRGAPLEKIPSLVFTLIHLRYLSMRGTNVRLVPKSIRKLQNLETLDLKYTYVTELPAEILRLHKLRHVLVYRYDVTALGFKAPYKIGDLISLQKLCYIEAGEIKGSGGSCNIVTEIGKLTQLRRLGITKLRRKDGTAFCSSIEKLTNLRSLNVISVAEDEILDVQSLSSAPQFLRTLALEGRLEKLPKWIPSLHSLVKICLRHSQLGDGPLQSLEALPNLEIILLFRAYEGESLTFKAGGFQRLKVLGLLQLKRLRSVTVEDGAMPHLEKLRFEGCKLVDELPSGLQHLTNLQFLGLVDMPDKLTAPLQGQGNPNIAHIPKVWIGGG